MDSLSSNYFYKKFITLNEQADKEAKIGCNKNKINISIPPKNFPRLPE